MSDIDEKKKNAIPKNQIGDDEFYEDERELKRGVLDEFSRPAGIPLNRSTVNPSLHSAHQNVYGAMPPPPPFGAYPPPPPPPNFYGYPPPPPPPPMPENMGIEYDANGNPVLVEYEYEEEIVEEEEIPSTAWQGVQAIPPQMQVPMPPPVPAFTQESVVEKNVIERESLKGRSVSINDQSLISRQKEGAEKATEIQNEEKKEQRKSFFLKTLLLLFVMSALTAGAFFVFSIIKPVHEALPDDLNASRNLASESYWNLKPSKPNNVVMRFYEVLGGVNQCGSVYDKMVWGSLHIGIRIEQFYCIEKRGIAYVKVGVAPNENIFLLNAEGKAKKLLTPSIAGDFEVLDIVETEALNALMFFDESLHKAAFVDYVSNNHPFKDLGHMTYNNEVFDAIEFQTLSGTKISYYFDLKTNLLIYKFVEQKGVVSRTEYQDYTDFKGVMLPRVRNVFINDKPYGTAIFDTVKFNRDIIFPR